MEFNYNDKVKVLRFYGSYLLYVTAILIVFANNSSLLIAAVLWGIPGYGFVAISLFIRHVINRKNLNAPDFVLSEKLLRIKHRLGFYMDYHLSDLVFVRSKGKLLILSFMGESTRDNTPKVVIDIERISSEAVSEFERLLKKRAFNSKQSSEPVLSLEGTLAVINLNALDVRGVQYIVDKLEYLSRQLVIDRYRIKHFSRVVDCNTFDVAKVEALLA